MTLRVAPEGLAAAGAAVEALSARLSATDAVAATVITAVAPPPAQGVGELRRSGIGVAESSTSYATGDVAAAVTHLIAGG